MMFKKEILKLHADIREIQKTHIKLKSAKEFIGQYNSKIINCQVDCAMIF